MLSIHWSCNQFSILSIARVSLLGIHSIYGPKDKVSVVPADVDIKQDPWDRQQHSLMEQQYSIGRGLCKWHRIHSVGIILLRRIATAAFLPCSDSCAMQPSPNMGG